MDPAAKPSFSPYRKWSIGFQVALLLLLVLSVVVMANYISQAYFARFHLNAHSQEPLSPRTVNLLDSLTNQVKVTIYYDKQDQLYDLIAELVNEFKLASSKISVQTVDYEIDQTAALQLKEKYPFLASPNAKNLIIFDCAGKVKAVEGNQLAKYVLEQNPDSTEPSFRRRPTDFLGELLFSSALLNVTSPKPLVAYFLKDDGEASIESEDPSFGFQKFASVLQQNYVQPATLSLLGTNPVPMDCSLLVIAGPTDRLSDGALEKIEQYLNQGGRLLALFNFKSANKETGLEGVLAKWGVSVGPSVIKDPDHTTQMNLSDIKVENFGQHPQHPLVNPLLQKRLHLIMPRPVSKLSSGPPAAGAPRVEELAFCGPRSFLDGKPASQCPFPLLVAVEKAAINGVITERGTTRMVVAGDSIFLGNHYIDSAANRAFAGYVINWLLDRTQLLAGIGSRPVREYRLTMTRSELQRTQWILLAAMPGGILLLGSLVWLRRRH